MFQRDDIYAEDVIASVIQTVCISEWININPGILGPCVVYHSTAQGKHSQLY